MSPELDAQWIKQHLRIKAFYGTSESAVKTQIWIAISIYVLIAIIKKQVNISALPHGEFWHVFVKDRIKSLHNITDFKCNGF